ncbi:YafY family protein [uncultured Olegusella sp.]|uniref:helix-turn-helix transcriptional regulator n=1 Tax=uncultured Olegusella sp. TaxID=1979846 RepID=UPI002610849D|nr:WYL domain-containing protein [uncultured Olegusella sp.]
MKNVMNEVDDSQKQDEQNASYELNADEELARRLLSLVLAFSNATAPLSSAYVQKEYYPTLSPESFRRQFHRDRERLLACGLLLHEAKKGWWVADEASFATEVSLYPDELLALDLTLSQLADDSEFPQSNDLRYALAKIDADYSKVSAARFSLTTTKQNRQLNILLHAATQHHPVQVSYVSALGERTERLLAIYGEFGLRGHIYFVAADLDEDLAPTAAEPHIFRDDRFLKVHELRNKTYDIPHNFNVAKWRKLPFQIGNKSFEIQLLFGSAAGEEALRTAQNYGTYTSTERGLVWTVEAADLEAAARWSIAEGLIPQQPSELVSCWKTLLKEALA